MKYEKILKRPDGSRVNISITFWNDSYSDKVKYKVDVSVCEPKKRIFRYVNDTDNYVWRKLSHEEKEVYEMNCNLRHVTIEEIQETALELWEKMKPNFKIPIHENTILR